MSKKVLIVEDEKLLARTLSTALREAGYEAVVAHSAEQGEEQWLAAESDFDLVILDNRLPVRSGLELLKVARDQGTDCPVIMMTAFDNRGVKAEARRLGVTRYLRKPFDLHSMLTEVNELIGAPGLPVPMKPNKEGGD